MESDPVELDEHRGMAAQKATDIGPCLRMERCTVIRSCGSRPQK
jgi:hypothetical protein